MLRWGSSVLIISMICFAILVYLALPTFRVFDWLFGNLDDEVRLQLLVLATAFFIFGIVILLACIVTLTIKRALLKAEAFQIELDKLLLPKILIKILKFDFAFFHEFFNFEYRILDSVTSVCEIPLLNLFINPSDKFR